MARFPVWVLLPALLLLVACEVAAEVLDNPEPTDPIVVGGTAADRTLLFPDQLLHAVQEVNVIINSTTVFVWGQTFQGTVLPLPSSTLTLLGGNGTDNFHVNISSVTTHFDLTVSGEDGNDSIELIVDEPASDQFRGDVDLTAEWLNVRHASTNATRSFRLEGDYCYLNEFHSNFTDLQLQCGEVHAGDMTLRSLWAVVADDLMMGSLTTERGVLVVAAGEVEMSTVDVGNGDFNITAQLFHQRAEVTLADGNARLTVADYACNSLLSANGNVTIRSHSVAVSLMTGIAINASGDVTLEIERGLSTFKPQQGVLVVAAGDVIVYGPNATISAPYSMIVCGGDIDINAAVAQLGNVSASALNVVGSAFLINTVRAAEVDIRGRQSVWIDSLTASSFALIEGGSSELASFGLNGTEYAALDLHGDERFLAVLEHWGTHRRENGSAFSTVHVQHYEVAAMNVTGYGQHRWGAPWDAVTLGGAFPSTADSDVWVVGDGGERGAVGVVVRGSHTALGDLVVYGRGGGLRFHNLTQSNYTDASRNGVQLENASLNSTSDLEVWGEGGYGGSYVSGIYSDGVLVMIADSDLRVNGAAGANSSHGNPIGVEVRGGKAVRLEAQRIFVTGTGAHDEVQLGGGPSSGVYITAQLLRFTAVSLGQIIGTPADCSYGINTPVYLQAEVEMRISGGDVYIEGSHNAEGFLNSNETCDNVLSERSTGVHLEGLRLIVSVTGEFIVDGSAFHSRSEADAHGIVVDFDRATVSAGDNAELRGSAGVSEGGLATGIKLGAKNGDDMALNATNVVVYGRGGNGPRGDQMSGVYLQGGAHLWQATGDVNVTGIMDFQANRTRDTSPQDLPHTTSHFTTAATCGVLAEVRTLTVRGQFLTLFGSGGNHSYACDDCHGVRVLADANVTLTADRVDISGTGMDASEGQGSVGVWIEAGHLLVLDSIATHVLGRGGVTPFGRNEGVRLQAELLQALGATTLEGYGGSSGHELAYGGNRGVTLDVLSEYDATLLSFDFYVKGVGAASGGDGGNIGAFVRAIFDLNAPSVRVELNGTAAPSNFTGFNRGVEAYIGQVRGVLDVTGIGAPSVFGSHCSGVEMRGRGPSSTQIDVTGLEVRGAAAPSFVGHNAGVLVDSNVLADTAYIEGYAGDDQLDGLSHGVEVTGTLSVRDSLEVLGYGADSDGGAGSVGVKLGSLSANRAVAVRVNGTGGIGHGGGVGVHVSNGVNVLAELIEVHGVAGFSSYNVTRHEGGNVGVLLSGDVTLRLNGSSVASHAEIFGDGYQDYEGGNHGVAFRGDALTLHHFGLGYFAVQGIAGYGNIAPNDGIHIDVHSVEVLLEDGADLFLEGFGGWGPADSRGIFYKAEQSEWDQCATCGFFFAGTSGNYNVSIPDVGHAYGVRVEAGTRTSRRSVVDVRGGGTLVIEGFLGNTTAEYVAPIYWGDVTLNARNSSGNVSFAHHVQAQGAVFEVDNGLLRFSAGMDGTAHVEASEFGDVYLFGASRYWVGDVDLYGNATLHLSGTHSCNVNAWLQSVVRSSGATLTRNVQVRDNATLLLENAGCTVVHGTVRVEGVGSRTPVLAFAIPQGSGNTPCSSFPQLRSLEVVYLHRAEVQVVESGAGGYAGSFVVVDVPAGYRRLHVTQMVTDVSDAVSANMMLDSYFAGPAGNQVRVEAI